MEKYFVAGVGAVYVLLGLWCAIQPERTSKTVGFTLQPGSGQSEFLTVYGGLEVGLGIALLWPLFRAEYLGFALLLCLLVHGCLVLFRTIGFVLFSGMQSTTYYLAVVEWGIFLASAFHYWRRAA